MQRAVNAGIVIVISAGNDGEKPNGAIPIRSRLTPAQNFPGMVIIAGSVGVDDGVGGTRRQPDFDFSNRAGTGADYYLMALGYQRPRARRDRARNFCGRAPASRRRRSAARWR